MTRGVSFLLFLFALSVGGAVHAQVPLSAAVQEQGLQKAIVQYQALLNARTWTALPEDICVKPGTQDRFIPTVRNLLCLTRDLAQCATPDSSYFDEHLVAAVKRFQKRHGLEADGVLGCKTLTALNVSPARRLQQLQVNLARWQDSTWAVQNYPMVLVNIPEYSLYLLNRQAQPIWKTRVIVGQIGKPFQTRQINSKISYLVVRPTWNVPKSIIRNEIIPAVRRDPGYLARHQMTVYIEKKGRQIPVAAGSVNWKAVDARRLTIIQRPGAKNSLGLVKFIFHNPFSIYLHDTPTKSLFKHPVRAYSHGCVRVEHPEKLAAYLMNPEWGKPSSFSLKTQSGANQTVFLPKPVPVQIRYFTSWIDDQGILQFREDVYGLDKVHLLSSAL